MLYSILKKDSNLFLSSGQSHSVNCQYIYFEMKTKKKYRSDIGDYLNNSKEESNHFIHLCINVIVVPQFMIIP